jgi:DNA-binding response OmpR family regulator
VDDEPDVLGALMELLRNAGHSVTTAPNAIAALAAFAPRRFDVVLSNVGMAGMNGWELAQRIRATDTSVAILFITGWGLRDEDRVRLNALNVEQCLFKPIGPVELDTAIQASLASR